MALIPYTNIENDDPADANLWNSRFGAILAQVNGNLDSTNIKKGSLTRDLFALDALSAMYPVGSVYITVDESMNPESFFGGTWVSFGAGKVIVGLDETQTEFNEIEKTGGDKNMQKHTHTGTTNSAGAHTHTYTDNAATGQKARWQGTPVGQSGVDPQNKSTGSAGAHTHTFTTSEAGTGTSGNLQPYIVVKMWKRVA